MHNFGGGRSDLFNSGGRWSKGGKGYIQNSGGSWLKGELKNLGRFGPWMKLCVYTINATFMHPKEDVCKNLDFYQTPPPCTSGLRLIFYFIANHVCNI